MLWSYGTEECEQALKNGSVVLVCTGSRGVTIFGQCSAVIGSYNSLFGLRSESAKRFQGNKKQQQTNNNNSSGNCTTFQWWNFEFTLWYFWVRVILNCISVWLCCQCCGSLLPAKSPSERGAAKHDCSSFSMPE